LSQVEDTMFIKPIRLELVKESQEGIAGSTLGFTTELGFVSVVGFKDTTLDITREMLFEEDYT